MRAARVALAIAIALALQTTLAHTLTGATTTVDLMLVAVVYVALTGGSVAGLAAGAIGGLVQDALSTTGASVVAVGSGVVAAKSIIGIGGLAKTVVGFVAGIVGTQFIVVRPLPRFLVFFVRRWRTRSCSWGCMRSWTRDTPAHRTGAWPARRPAMRSSAS